MYTAIVVALLAVVMVTPVHAQVHVDIGIHFPAPPPLVVVPETPWVQYVPPVPPVPAEPANLFFYNGQYWAFANGGWYLGPGYNGPWIVVAPEFVPRPVLLVPMPYYHVPPGHWASGKTVGPRAGMRSGDASGRKSGSGEAANMNGTTITTSIDGAAAGETDRAARRLASSTTRVAEAPSMATIPTPPTAWTTQYSYTSPRRPVRC